MEEDIIREYHEEYGQFFGEEAGGVALLSDEALEDDLEISGDLDSLPL